MISGIALADPMSNPVVFQLGPVPVTQVVVVTWGMMGLVFAVAALVRLRLRRDAPGRLQTAVEAALDWLGDEVRSIIGRDPAPFLPLIASLFLFVLVANLLSFVSSFFEVVRPPTADIHTTAALAGVVFLAVPFYGVAITGVRSYLRTYVRPTWIMLPFNLIGDVSRTLSLAVRLFGNIFSGEILFGVVLSLVPFILPLPLMFLSLITGTIQAYIFAVLATVYIGGAVKVVEKHALEETVQ